jgi:6-phosphogluconolactonase
MLSLVPVPLAHVHRVPTQGLDPEEAAIVYERTLKDLYGAEELVTGKPLLDLCLLGLGEDGHTASLIPGEAVLEERRRWVAVVGHGRPQVRITLTYPALESSSSTVFLVQGEGKRAMLDRLLSGDETIPAGKLRPQGDLFYLVDQAAAGKWAGG